MLFARTILTRSGMSNRLFPWARCTVFACSNGIPMLAPRWVQLKIGPLLRGERDLRTYHGMFRHLDAEVGGFARWGIAAALPRLPEPDDLTRAPKDSWGVVTFEGLGDFFARLDGWRGLLAARFLASARPDIVLEAQATHVAPIGVHVRRGDFRVSEDQPELGAIRTPIKWFIHTLDAIRGAVGKPIPAFVVSDGDEQDLAGLMAKENVTLQRAETALGEFLLLTRAKVILGSRGSSFSAWSSFFADAPVATTPGMSFGDEFRFTRPGGPFVGSFDPERPDDRFLEDAVRYLTRIDQDV